MEHLSIKNIALRVFRSESEAIAALAERVDGAFEQAVRLLADCKGKVVVCGVGKSGLIGKKMAATLSSTGTPSYFLHPSDALHGDLGAITANDCMISISNSGETDEILQLIPQLKRIQLPHITLVGNPHSTLARHAQIALNIGVAEEGAMLAAVPMASVAATLAMGDALAAALMFVKNFQQQDFALLHPAGNIGRKLVTQVGDVMRTHDLPVVQRQSPIQEVMLQLSAGMLGVAVVCDAHGIVLGIITDGDLRRALNRHPNASFFELVAEMIMSPQPKMVRPEQTLLEAEELLQQYKITALLVADEQYVLKGIITKYLIR